MRHKVIDVQDLLDQNTHAKMNKRITLFPHGKNSSPSDEPEHHTRRQQSCVMHSASFNYLTPTFYLNSHISGGAGSSFP